MSVVGWMGISVHVGVGGCGCVGVGGCGSVDGYGCTCGCGCVGASISRSGLSVDIRTYVHQ